MTMTPFVPEVRPRLSGGGLTAAYIFSEAHFHWGDLTAGGSEHTKGRVKKKSKKCGIFHTWVDLPLKLKKVLKINQY